MRDLQYFIRIQLFHFSNFRDFRSYCKSSTLIGMPVDVFLMHNHSLRMEYHKANRCWTSLRGSWIFVHCIRRLMFKPLRPAIKSGWQRLIEATEVLQFDGRMKNMGDCTSPEDLSPLKYISGWISHCWNEAGHPHVKSLQGRLQWPGSALMQRSMGKLIIKLNNRLENKGHMCTMSIDIL